MKTGPHVAARLRPQDERPVRNDGKCLDKQLSAHAAVRPRPQDESSVRFLSKCLNGQSGAPSIGKKGSILVSLLKFLIFVIFFIVLVKFAEMYSIKLINSFFNKEETKVPNIVSRDGTPVRIKEALDLCKQHRLQLDIRESRFDNNIPEDCIISQEPPPDTIVKVSRVVEVILSKGAKTIDCPDVAGKDVREVTFLIQNKGFLLGKKSYVYSETIPGEVIIAQTPEGNSKVPKGTQIDMLVSMGKANKTVQIPNFVNKKIEAAKIVLGKINLEPGKIGYDSKEGTEPGTILKQDPAPGAVVQEGSQVSFMVVEGPEQLAPDAPAVDNKAIAGDTAAVDVPVKQTPAPKAAGTEGVEASDGKRVEIVKFIVPPGQKSREIKIVLLDEAGPPREIYKDFHYPGEEIDLTVTGYGNMKVLVYLDNVFFKDFELGGR